MRQSTKTDLATTRGFHAFYRAALPLSSKTLSYVFGQRAEPVSYSSPAASLLLNSPARVRGGLMFTTEIVITPRQQLRDAWLYLDNGWFEAMTLNGVAPQPSNEGAQGRWQVWEFGQLPVGTAFHVWISWQTNPTNVGRHRQTVALYDGGTQLMTADHALTVFP